MKTFATFSALASLALPGSVLAHPGHGLGEHTHSLLHGEHLVILAALIGLVYAVRRVRARHHDD